MLVNVGTKLLWFYFNNFDIFQLFELYNYTKIIFWFNEFKCPSDTGVRRTGLVVLGLALLRHGPKRTAQLRYPIG